MPLIQNDRILSETCLQFADHYARLQNIAIENEQNMRLNKRPRPDGTTHQRTGDCPDSGIGCFTDFDVPAPSNAEEELSAEDKTVQAMDLSIPITVMQEIIVIPPNAPRGIRGRLNRNKRRK